MLRVYLCSYWLADAQTGELDLDKEMAAFVEESKEIWFVGEYKDLIFEVGEDKDPAFIGSWGCHEKKFN